MYIFQCIHCSPVKHRTPDIQQPAYPACSTAVVTSLPFTIVVLNISGMGCSANTPSSSPSTGRFTLMLLHLAVVISAPRQSFERKMCPESVESSWIVGAEPVICSWNDGELVTEMDEITLSTSTLVFVQFTAVQRGQVRRARR